MNRLVITSGLNNTWFAVVSNTDILYKFKGATSAEQYTQVEALSRYLQMYTDGETVTRMLPEMFENVTNPTGVFDSLFRGTSSLALDEEVVIDLGANALAEEIMEVGEALLAAL